MQGRCTFEVTVTYDFEPTGEADDIDITRFEWRFKLGDTGKCENDVEHNWGIAVLEVGRNRLCHLLVRKQITEDKLTECGAAVEGDPPIREEDGSGSNSSTSARA